MREPDPPERPVGRFAPSPTGGLHLGSALVALGAWLSVRSRGGRFVWRVEDLDGPRAVPGAEAAQIADARWLGLDWDEGPEIGGPHAPYRQSERGAHYEAALGTLAEAGRLFPCRRSRKDLQALATAPHGRGGLPPYPVTLRPKHLPPDWFDTYRTTERPDAALRFRVSERGVAFDDRVQGRIIENVAAEVGDFVLKRRDGVYAYQLAVVVDDLLMGVTEVVRGADLLDSAARQLQLIDALGGTPPAYAHLPLVVNAQGKKLSKRDGVADLSGLRDRGVAPEALVGWLAHATGLLDAPRAVTPAALVAAFSWERIRSEPITVPDDLPGTLAISTP